MLFRRLKKGRQELQFWQERAREEGQLSHDHYEQFYTTIFGLNQASYDGKRVLDIGCGPRGSLEWADGAAERVGLDPLVNEYRKLGIDRHKMRYVNASSDKIPFPTAYFDIVTSFNSLDHVDNLERTIREISRVTKDGGSFLLIAEINHPPTPTEPITLRQDALVRAFEPSFTIKRSWCSGMLPQGHDIYGSVLAGAPHALPEAPGVLCAFMVRNSTPSVGG